MAVRAPWSQRADAPLPEYAPGYAQRRDLDRSRTRTDDTRRTPSTCQRQRHHRPVTTPRRHRRPSALERANTHRTAPAQDFLASVTIERRSVRVAESFFEQFDSLLPADRDNDGTPSATDFLVLELPAIVERFALSFDQLPEITEGLSTARMLIAPGILVALSSSTASSPPTKPSTSSDSASNVRKMTHNRGRTDRFGLACHARRRQAQRRSVRSLAGDIGRDRHHAEPALHADSRRNRTLNSNVREGLGDALETTPARTRPSKNSSNRRPSIRHRTDDRILTTDAVSRWPDESTNTKGLSLA